MKTFEYNVNGTIFEDTEAFGQGWKNAVALAKEEHATITRTVVNGDEIHYEFDSNGGCFLNNRFYEKDKVKVF